MVVFCWIIKYSVACSASSDLGALKNRQQCDIFSVNWWVALEQWKRILLKWRGTLRYPFSVFITHLLGYVSGLERVLLFFLKCPMSLSLWELQLETSWLVTLLRDCFSNLQKCSEMTFIQCQSLLEIFLAVFQCIGFLEGVCMHLKHCVIQ